MPCRGPDSDEGSRELRRELDAMTRKFCDLGKVVYGALWDSKKQTMDDSISLIDDALDDWYNHRNEDKHRVISGIESEIRRLKQKEKQIIDLGGTPNDSLANEIFELHLKADRVRNMGYHEDFEA